MPAMNADRRLYIVTEQPFEISQERIDPVNSVTQLRWEFVEGFLNKGLERVFVSHEDA